MKRVLEMTSGRGADVVIDAAAGTTRTVVQAMEMVRRGGKVVIGGVKERKPVEGFISDWIPLRGITVMPGIPGDHAERQLSCSGLAACRLRSSWERSSPWRTSVRPSISWNARFQVGTLSGQPSSSVAPS